VKRTVGTDASLVGAQLLIKKAPNIDVMQEWGKRSTKLGHFCEQFSNWTVP